jgi:hypothetical protein
MISHIIFLEETAELDFQFKSPFKGKSHILL